MAGVTSAQAGPSALRVQRDRDADLQRAEVAAMVGRPDISVHLAERVPPVPAVAHVAGVHAVDPTLPLFNRHAVLQHVRGLDEQLAAPDVALPGAGGPPDEVV